jgi:hypothetical protein
LRQGADQASARGCPGPLTAHPPASRIRPGWQRQEEKPPQTTSEQGGARPGGQSRIEDVGRLGRPTEVAHHADRARQNPTRGASWEAQGWHLRAEHGGAHSHCSPANQRRAMRLSESDAISRSPQPQGARIGMRGAWPHPLCCHPRHAAPPLSQLRGELFGVLPSSSEVVRFLFGRPKTRGFGLDLRASAESKLLVPAHPRRMAAYR